MDELDDLLARVRAGSGSAAPQPSADEYGSLLSQVRGQRQAQVQSSVIESSFFNPDKEAEKQRLVRDLKAKLGEDWSPAAVDPLEAARRLKVAEADHALRNSPKLAENFLNPEFARIANDDVDTLSRIEKMWSGRTLAGTLGDIGITALKGAVGLPQAFVGLADIPTFGYAGKALEAAGFRFNETQKILDEMYSSPQQRANAEVRNAEGFDATLLAALTNPSTIATTVGESVPQMLGGAAIGRKLLTAGGSTLAADLAGPEMPSWLLRLVGDKWAPILAGALGEGAISAGSQAEQIRAEQDDGLLSAKQSLAALGSGLGTALFSVAGGKVAQRLGIADIDTALVKGGLDKASAEVLKKGFARRMAEAGVSEGLFEELPQSAQEQMWQNFATERPLLEGVGNAAAMGLLAGLTTGGAAEGYNSFVNRLEAHHAKQEQAEQAARFGALMTEMSNLAEASRLRERDVASAQGYFQSLLDEGQESVFITPEALAQSGMAEQIAAAIPEVREQLQSAAEVDHDIRLPIADLMAVLPGDQLNQSILPHVSETPGGFTQTTAQEYMQSDRAQQLEKIVEETLREKGDDDAFKQSQAAVKQAVLDNLNQVGRFTAQKNEADATLISSYAAVRAAQLGMMPEQFFAKHMLKVQAEGILGEQYSQGDSLESVRQVWSDAGIKHAISEKNGIITVSQIVVPESERGAGKGTAAMQALIDYADRTGQHVALSPSSDFGGNKKRLVQFYKRFGFVENKGKNRAFTTSESMYRQAEGKVLHQSGNVSLSAPQDVGEGLTPNTRVQRMSIVSDGQNAGVVSVEVGGDGTVTAIYTLNIEEGQRGTGIGSETLRQLLQSDNDVNIEGITDERAKQWWESRGAVVKDTRGVISKAGFLAATDARAGKTAQGNPGSGRGRNGETGEEQSLSQSTGNRGSYNPATDVITLLKGADLSTFLHESGHYFFETDIALASQIAQDARVHGYNTLTEGEKQILADVSALMSWHGIQGSIDQQLGQWASMDFEERRAYHERTAESFEHYLFEGKAPSIELQGYFQKFRAWLTNVYRSVKDFLAGHPEAGKLNDEVRGVFDRMLATTEQIKLAEQARSMMPLFTSAEQAGMTPEEFAAYQATGIDATNEAIQELQAKGVRDMQWMRNARAKVLRRLQRQAKDERAAVQIEARRQIMSEPVYRAWQFLTAKLTADDMTPAQLAEDRYRKDSAAWRAARRGVEDQARSEISEIEWQQSEEGRKKYRKLESMQKARKKFISAASDAIEKRVAERLAAWEKDHPEPQRPTGNEPPKSDPNVLDESMDSLFVAIAKLGGLNKNEVTKTWGTDPADKPTSGVFGKPVWRVEGGLSIDGMAEALAQYGYLTLDEHGKVDVRELEELFAAELRGDTQFSNAYAPQQFVEDSIANPYGLTAGRFLLSGLSDIGLPAEIINTLKAHKMTGKEGLHPDLVAEMFGFSSGDELARAIAAAESPKEAIEGLTDRMMLERHGELATPEAIEREADKAIHNDVRARMVATELRALEAMLSHKEQVGTNREGKPIMRRTLPAAAKQYAEAMIARLKIRNIRPGQYTAAEVRAAKAATEATMSGNTEQAAVEKRNQMVNLYATKAAYNALDEVDAGVRYLKKFDGDYKNLDPDYLAQIQALLERFDLRKQSLKAIDRKSSLAAWIESQREQGLEPEVPDDLVNEAFKKSFKDMTLEEFRGLVDTIKQIEHLGRLKNKLLTAKDQREFAAVRDLITASIEQFAGDREANTRTPDTVLGKSLLEMREFGASHIKAATWARIMDGGKDGGPVWEYFVRSANERGDMETSMRAAATQRLSEILAPLFKAGKLTTKTFFPSINRSLTREARIAIALNVGNEGNLQRLTGGEGWTPAQILPVLQSLTAEEWQAVQAIWDHFESYRPEIGAKEKRVYGKEPKWVDPGSSVLDIIRQRTGLTLRGGYYPIKYDPMASQRAEEHADAEGAKRQIQGAYTSATTRRSFTKSRAEEVSGRPLLYTLAGVYSGVNDVIHDLSWHEWLIDVNRLLRSNKIDQAIRTHYGPEVKAQFKEWAKDIAEGEKASSDATDLFFNYMRQSVSVAGLGFNLVSALMQPLGITQSIVRVGATWTARGIRKYLAHPVALTRKVNSMSDFMLNRARTRNRELNELRNQVEGQSKLKEAVGKYAYFAMMRFQQMVDVPTWWGAYEKAIAAGNDDARAIALADQAVIDSQGGGQLKDQAGIERVGAGGKLFTVFYSFMNTALNLGVTTGMTEKSRAKQAANYALLYVVPAILGYALKAALTPGDADGDDPEEIARKLLAAQIDYMMGLMVGVREFADVAKTLAGANDAGRDYQGPAGLRMIADAGKFAMQVGQGDMDDSLRKAFINLIGDLFGLPSAQINRTITGAEALADGETSNPAALVFGFQTKH